MNFDRWCGCVGAFLILQAIAACSSSSESPPLPSAGDAGKSGAATVVTSSSGGKVVASDGSAILSVSGGAVASDVRVTVDVQAATAATKSAIYRYEPRETTFAVPATLSISTAGIELPDGKELALAVEHDSKWQLLSDAKAGASAIEAPIHTLGSFALVVTDAKGASNCDATCMSKPGATCCEACGCNAEVRCTPQCAGKLKWDCEMKCCFDYDAVTCR